LPNQPNSPIPDPTTSSQQHHSGADEDMVGLFVHMWSKFKRAYKKEYSDNLEEMRAQKTFFSNMVHIAANQHLFAKGEISYEQAINAFSDVSFSNATHLNLKLGISRIKRGFDTDSASRFYVLKKLKSRVGFPNEFDWRAYEVETEVRDQGNCGSCWAFAVSGALEGVYSFFNRENVQFSPQELIDCSLQNFGCDGGWIDVAFAYLAEKKGLKWLAAEKAYPYQGEDHAACQNNSVTIAHYYESNPPSAFVLSCTVSSHTVFSSFLTIYYILIYKKGRTSNCSRGRGRN
jgi:cathepsin L